MFFTTTIVAAAALAGSTIAQQSTVNVVLETCQGGSSCTNKSVNPFLGEQLQLGGVPVSNLYLTAASIGVPINSVHCIPTLANHTSGPSFSYGHPVFISTNTVPLYGLSCTAGSDPKAIIIAKPVDGTNGTTTMTMTTTRTPMVPTATPIQNVNATAVHQGAAVARGASVGLAVLGAVAAVGAYVV